MNEVQVALRDGRRAVMVFSDRADGDLASGADRSALAEARRAIVDRPWTWLTQVHGADVVVVARAGDHAGEEADAAVTAASSAPVAVQAADCAPVVLVDAEGAVGVVHAGWRGLLDGVIGAAVSEMRARPGAGEISAYLGPCIHAECYEFSATDLEPIVDRFGPAVAARTEAGTPALDVPAAVAAAVAECDVPLDTSHAGCTSCHAATWFSHRARAERGRHAAIAWIEP